MKAHTKVHLLVELYQILSHIESITLSPTIIDACRDGKNKIIESDEQMLKELSREFKTKQGG